MITSSLGTALITGASSGIGAIYADRFARRGHDLILVARNRDRLNSLAKRISDETQRSVTVIPADLNNRADLARIEDVLRTGTNITTLVNNAGVGAPSSLLDADIDNLTRMIDLNISAIVRLTYAVLPRFVERRNGAIINMGSVVGIAPELLNGVYGGTKAFVLAFSLALHREFAGRNIRIQAVLPGATATDFWDIAETPLSQIPGEFVMNAEEMVDAAIAGFYQGELITIPSLPDVVDWEKFEIARQNLIPKLSLSSAAARYGVKVKRLTSNLA